MAETFTKSDGTFFVDGKIPEWLSIDPVLKIYHDCNDASSCTNRWKIYLPKSHILAVDEDPENKTLDIGVYNLEINWRTEERNCVH